MSEGTLKQLVNSNVSSAVHRLEEIQLLKHAHGPHPSIENTTICNSPLENDAFQMLSSPNHIFQQIIDGSDSYFSAQELTSDTILELLNEFPDIPKFIRHDVFLFFANTWLNFQSVKIWAKHPEKRPKVLRYFRDILSLIPRALSFIVKSSSGNENVESQSRPMFSALRKLKDHIEVTHQIIVIVENGRIQHNQTPAEAIAPLRKAAEELNIEISQLLSSDIDNNTVNEKDDFYLFYKSFSELSMDEVSNVVLQSYSLMPQSPLESNFKQMDADNSNDKYTTSHMTNFESHSNQPDYHVNMENEQSARNMKDSTKRNKYVWIQERIPGYTPQAQTKNLQSNQLKISVKPAVNQHCINSQFLDKQEGENRTVLSISSSGINKTELEKSSNQHSSPDSMTSESKSQEFLGGNKDKYTTFHDSEQDSSSKNEDDDEYIEEYMNEDVEDDSFSSDEPPKKHQRASKGRITKNKLKKPVEEYQKKISTRSRVTRRTATSYDSRTTHYLKSVFFDKYSKNDKLTKEQRRQVQKDTGLKPRNITYWFSNHKRRFRHALAKYQKTVKESNGQIKCYNDFIEWRKSQGLSEEVMDWE